jgi:hypothetical protein
MTRVPKTQRRKNLEGKVMRKSFLGIGLGVAAMLLAVGAFAAEAPEATTIDDCVAKKAAVEFPHAAHFEATECTTCHHTSEGLTADSAGGMEVQACGACHTTPEEATTPECSQMSLKKNPYHIACVGCHKEASAGPTKCDDCHPKADG